MEAVGLVTGNGRVDKWNTKITVTAAHTTSWKAGKTRQSGCPMKTLLDGVKEDGKGFDFYKEHTLCLNQVGTWKT